MASFVALSTVTAGCGLSTDTGFTRLDTADDRFGLSQTTSSTTSTTMVPTTQVTNTVDAAPTTTLPPTSSTIATELVDLFFVSGSRLTSVAAPLPAEPTLGQVLAVLVDGTPSGALGAGLRTALPAGVEIEVEEAGGIASIVLPTDYFDSILITDQRFVFAQLVLTLTDRPGIGQVRFSLGDEPMRVFRGDASLTAPGETVSRDDYVRLVIGVPAETGPAASDVDIDGLPADPSGTDGG